MSAFDQALVYARAGLAVFPCRPDKRPIINGWPAAATTDERTIEGWWRHHPNALIGMPTGQRSGVNVLDIDVKHPPVDGWNTLADLGFETIGELETPIVRTRSGGTHIWFARGEHEIRNTAGDRGTGIGPGLDWRGEGGYVVVPSPGSGYHWERGPEVPLAAIPAELLPKAPPERTARPIEPVTGLSPYATAALDSACRRIIAARPGEQEATLNGECFSIGRLAGAGTIPEGIAREALIWSARQIPDYDPRRPWRATEIDRKVEIAFAAGLAQPREVPAHA